MSVCGQQKTAGNYAIDNIRPTASQYARAVRRALRAIEMWSNDGDLGRGDDEWEQDVFLGALAEVVAHDELQDALALDTRLVDDGEDASYDIDLAGLVELEVKNRKLWDRQEPDMLIRRRTAVDADCYMLAEIDRDEDSYLITVSGWVSQPEVMAYSEDFVFGNHEKLMVHRRHLRAVTTLPDQLNALSGR